jgi:hypothetical protein
MLSAALLAVAASGQAAGLYKWTDSEGNVHYTQSPPPQGEFKQLTVPKTPPAPPPQAESAPAAPPQDKGAELEAERKKLEANIAKHNCEAARKNLEIYTITRRVLNEQGEVEVLDDDVRAAKIKEANDMIQQYCQ